MIRMSTHHRKPPVLYKFSTSFKMWTSSAALLALLSSVFAIPLGEAPSAGLDVTLSQIEDTRIKAVVKNVGIEDVTFVHINFFKDTAPVKKVALYQDDGTFYIPSPRLNCSSYTYIYQIRRSCSREWRSCS